MAGAPEAGRGAAPPGNAVPPGGAVAVFTRGLARQAELADLLGAPLRLRPAGRAGIAAVAGWGRKANTRPALAFAARHGLPYLALEDGFLRSPGLPGAPAPLLSLLVDRSGVHYDAYGPSDLETLLREGRLGEDAALMARAAAALERFLALGLSKYNPPAKEARPRGRQVLVLGQTPGDLSLACGMAAAWTPAALTHLAAAENPGARIVYRLHPDVVHGRKPPPADLDLVRRGAAIDASGGKLAEALAEAERVYTATSLAGFEALLRGLPVVVAGLPFWAGWGAASERAPPPARRGRRRSVLEIFAAAYLLYPRYRDPATAAPIGFEAALEALAQLRAGA